MTNPILDTKQLAEAYGLEFRDCGSGHVQILGHGVLVNYYPVSKRKTIFCPETGRRETHCTPWDAVSLCLKSGKAGMKPKAKVTKNRPEVDLQPVRSASVGYRHLYTGETPPWDESLGEFISAHSDLLREEASRLREQADIEDNLNWEYHE